MIDDEARLKELKGKAMRLIASVQDDLLDNANSFTHLLIKMHRVGHAHEKATDAFNALRELINDAESAYEFAIAQPEPRAVRKDRVVL